ncbi:MAG: HEAT repeat domain-containing protein, partial [Sciscionella sp.]
MLDGAGRQRRAEVREIVARARALAPEDYGRTSILSELHGIKPRAVLAAGVELVRSGDPTSMTLAADLLFGLYPRIFTSPLSMSTYRKLVEELCDTGNEPQVLATALRCFAWVKPADPRVLLGLLGHGDARVRESAVLAVAVRYQVPADENVQSTLIKMLEWDPDPGVRIIASAALFDVYRENPGRHPRIAETIIALREDPEPEIRVRAILVQAAGDTDYALTQLFNELKGLQPPWQIVGACSDLDDWPEASEPVRAKLRSRLIRLQEQGWAQRYEPGRYPDQADRAE